MVALACTSFGLIDGALRRMAAPERRGWAMELAGAADLDPLNARRWSHWMSSCQ